MTMALDKLPQMTERKKKIDMHVKIASKILSDIKSRQIDKLQDIEDEILSSRKVTGENKQDLLNLLGLETHLKEQFTDKVRVLVMMILCLADLELLGKFIQEVEKVHNSPEETQVLGKLNIMFNKRKTIEK
jgi:hypothetical protein